jgi:hypothetical protein
LGLSRAYVTEELRFVGSSVVEGCQELELVGLEKRARRGVGCFTPLRKVRAPRQGVRLAHGCAWTVDDLEIVVGEKFGPSGLSSVENLGRGEVLEIPVVRVDSERMCSSLEVSTPFLDGCDDSEHLFVVDLVVELCSSEFAGVERDRVQNAISTGLGENSSDSEVGSIGLDRGRAIRVEVGEHWSSGEGVLQLVKSLASWTVKSERMILLEESCERSCNLGKALDETTVEVGEPDEYLEITHRRRLGPINNSRDLLGIHLDT